MFLDMRMFSVKRPLQTKTCVLKSEQHTVSKNPVITMKAVNAVWLKLGMWIVAYRHTESSSTSGPKNRLLSGDCDSNIDDITAFLRLILQDNGSEDQRLYQQNCKPY